MNQERINRGQHWQIRLLGTAGAAYDGLNTCGQWLLVEGRNQIPEVFCFFPSLSLCQNLAQPMLSSLLPWRLPTSS